MSKFKITHSCGHQSVAQIVGPEKDRARKAAWLADQECSACKSNKLADERAQKSKQDAAATNTLVALVGSDKQVAWATSIRADLLVKLNSILIKGVERGMPANQASTAQRAIDLIMAETSAKVWIDYRQIDAEARLKSAWSNVV
ncbi:MAG: hypothetical protein RLZZ157_73 [Pseudomonadota bacterium]|jgi:hypothetical protein